jgi:hypothetical protein
VIESSHTVHAAAAQQRPPAETVFGTVTLHKRLLRAFAETSGLSMSEVRAGLLALEARGFLRPTGIGKSYELVIPSDGGQP